VVNLRRAAAALRELAAALDEEGAAATPAPGTPEYMTPDEYAARVHVTPRTVRKLVEDGMPSARIGRVLRVKVREADAWLELRNSGALARKSATIAATKGAIQ
jgi:excisionase family DNA binding protein